MVPVSLNSEGEPRLQTPNRKLNRKSGNPQRDSKDRAIALLDLEQRRRNKQRKQEERGQPKRTEKAIESGNEV